MLPEQFLCRMEQMLQEEYPQFLQSYEEERYQALRFNPQKGSRDVFLNNSMFSLKPVEWEPEGFYYDKDDMPGKHPYHEAGVYYIQEPSAMAPAAYLAAEPGEKVLDLCAAPGGKSTQIAAAMQGQGLLVSNEINSQRAKILSENIERMGIGNALVTNESPQVLAGIFIEYFDRIMVDAPCSGEGMFRKNETACTEWSLENVQHCADRQDEILECAASMLRPGGTMVYSTCTFAPEENEGTVSRFIRKHPDFKLKECPHYPGMMTGQKKWIQNPVPGLENAIRLFPHKIRGEGHFLAVLEKEGLSFSSHKGYCSNGEEKGIAEKDVKEYIQFCDAYMKKKLQGKIIRFGEQLYLAPEEMPALKHLKVLRPGLHLGTLKKNRFEPSHALALYLHPDEVRFFHDLKGDGTEIRSYLNGQTLSVQGEKGWYLVTVDGWSIGWGKLAGQIMKNHYPKGLRKPLNS